MAATTTKTANYTEAQEAAILKAAADAGGKFGQDVAATLAESFGKTLRSVTAKASRMGLYMAKEYTRKDGKAVEKKDATAEAIGAILNLSEGEVTSLAKANRTALQKVFAALANSKPIDD